VKRQEGPKSREGGEQENKDGGWKKRDKRKETRRGRIREQEIKCRKPDIKDKGERGVNTRMSAG